MPDAPQIMIFNKKRLKKIEIKRIWFHPKRWLAPRASIWIKLL
jgi:hypothetical protein